MPSIHQDTALPSLEVALSSLGARSNNETTDPSYAQGSISAVVWRAARARHFSEGKEGARNFPFLTTEKRRKYNTSRIIWQSLGLSKGLYQPLVILSDGFPVFKSACGDLKTVILGNRHIIRCHFTPEALYYQHFEIAISTELLLEPSPSDPCKLFMGCVASHFEA